MSVGHRAAADPVVCFCNEVRLGTIVDALGDGATTMAEIYDKTWAGCGPVAAAVSPI